MSDDEKFEKFMQKVLQRPLPNNPVEQIQLLAGELAEGVYKGVWDRYIIYIPSNSRVGQFRPDSPKLLQYLRRRWEDDHLKVELLKARGYLEDNNRLSKSAFDLVKEKEPSKVFISYKHSESSAFAFLIYEKLRAAEIPVFVDKDLRAGDNWYTSIESNVKQAETMIVLLSKETLKSLIVLDEIGWAIDANRKIIPVCHNYFEYKSDDWGNLPVRIDQILKNNQTIRVREESALDYSNTITELLKHFGVET